MGDKSRTIFTYGCPDFLPLPESRILHQEQIEYSAREINRSELKNLAEIPEIGNADCFCIIALNADEQGADFFTEKFFAALNKNNNIGIVCTSSPDRYRSLEGLIVLKKPIEKSEFFSIVFSLLLHFSNHIRISEDQWLRRIDHIFRLSSEELKTSEAAMGAFKTLVKFEANLRSEQEKISKALMALQEYRDVHEKEWGNEKKARESLAHQLQKEMISKEDEIKARDNLLAYSSKEEQILHKIIATIREKGTIDRTGLYELIKENDILKARFNS